MKIIIARLRPDNLFFGEHHKMTRKPIIDDTASILAEIPGGPELLDWFGGNPNFGDAEVMSLNLATIARGPQFPQK